MARHRQSISRSKITIDDINDAPTFDAPVTLHMTIAENAAPGTLVATYNATDVDGNDIIQGCEFRPA